MTIRTGSGDICYTRSDPDVATGADLVLTLCNYDPEFIALAVGAEVLTVNSPAGLGERRPSRGSGRSPLLDEDPWMGLRRMRRRIRTGTTSTRTSFGRSVTTRSVGTPCKWCSTGPPPPPRVWGLAGSEMCRRSPTRTSKPTGHLMMCPTLPMRRTTRTLWNAGSSTLRTAAHDKRIIN